MKIGAAGGIMLLLLLKLASGNVARTHSTNFPLHVNLCARTEETLKEIRNTEEIYLFQGKR